MFELTEGNVTYILIHFCYRFRVVDEMFVDTSPSGPETVVSAAAPTAGASESTDITEIEKKTPYTLTVSGSNIETIVVGYSETCAGSVVSDQLSPTSKHNIFTHSWI